MYLTDFQFCYENFADRCKFRDLCTVFSAAESGSIFQGRIRIQKANLMLFLIRKLMSMAQHGPDLGSARVFCFLMIPYTDKTLDSAFRTLRRCCQQIRTELKISIYIPHPGCLRINKYQNLGNISPSSCTLLAISGQLRWISTVSAMVSKAIEYWISLSLRYEGRMLKGLGRKDDMSPHRLSSATGPESLFIG